MHTSNIYKGNRKYKDRLFRLLFSDKKHLLQLYNALAHSNYDDPESLEITTLDDVLYMKMKNDVSVLLDDYLNLYEHQSTINPNLPLRGLFYFTELYRQISDTPNIYSTRQLMLPTPLYYVFYNGNQDMGECISLKLSDAFVHGNEQSKMELVATVLNINYGKNQELMEHCHLLKEYSIFIDRVKFHNKTYKLGTAIDLAIEDCLKQDVLKDFLTRRRNEVKNSILTEYNEKFILDKLSQESYEDGVIAGKIAGEKLGEERFAKLIQLLVAENKNAELIRASSDKEYRHQLFAEYNI